MSHNAQIRASRDGDQFHYWWAARRCLGLLATTSNLVAITIEGSSTNESKDESLIVAGEDLIDIAEYYGGEHLSEAKLIRYIQVKHSTLQSNVPWTASGLHKTIKGFASRYKEFTEGIGEQKVNAEFEFWFVSNRAINVNFLETVEDAANGVSARHPAELKKLLKFTSLQHESFSAFCKLLHLSGNHENYLEQRGLLFRELRGYLPGNDLEAPVQLKELVTRKALSESSSNPRITKIDVLRALNTDEYELFPANSQIEQLATVISRRQESQIIDQILSANRQPIIVHAAGGVGKSIISTRIPMQLPKGSVCVVYDCFGNGLYRAPSEYRHRAKDALVQIANELASKGLCHPLIPSSRADSGQYLRAFLYRVTQAVEQIKADNLDAILAIIVDAADNAQMAAEEAGQHRAFIRELINAQMPEGTRLIILCRTERQQLLEPPPQALRIELLSFEQAETAQLLKQKFPNASDTDVEEFHRLTYGNPRVQSTALAQNITLAETLRSLGPNPTTIEDTIRNLYRQAAENILHRASSSERVQIEQICCGLAILRPLIPISILASLANTDPAAIKSFAVDFGRSIRITDETVQFFDEPVETWFRDEYKPASQQLTGFINTLKPLTRKSAYAASVLPQLLLEAGQVSELVDLALSSSFLPTDNLIEKRDIELQRFQFAIKACLRENRFADAAKIALKASGEVAGEERQHKLIQANTDLAAQFLEVNTLLELVSRRIFTGAWRGANHVYEAGLFSFRESLRGDARSRLRLAHEWLNNWSFLSRDERKKEPINENDIAEIATAHLNVHGSDKCAAELRKWSNKAVSYNVGKIIASRLVDLGKYTTLNALALSAGNNFYLVLAILTELKKVGKSCPKEVVRRALRILSSPHVKLNIVRGFDDKEEALQSIIALVLQSINFSLASNEVLISLLTRYLPTVPSRGLSSDYGYGGRYVLMQAYTLRASLSGIELQIADLAYPEIKDEVLNTDNSSRSEVSKFRGTMEALLPWHHLWSKLCLGKIAPTEIKQSLTSTLRLTGRISHYRDERATDDEIALLWLNILTHCKEVSEADLNQFQQWLLSMQSRHIKTKTLIELARLASRSENLLVQSQAVIYTGVAFQNTHSLKDDAEEKAQVFVRLARAILTLHPSEAREYFHQAVDVASKIGDENLARWDVLLSLASRTAKDQPHPQLAYRFARCAELTYAYVSRDKHFPWEETVQNLVHLCPSSSLAIISRWRDRDFGRFKRLLPVVVDVLLETNKVEPLAALLLFCVSAEWDINNFLKQILNKLPTASDKRNAFDLIFHYAQFREYNLSVWQHVQSTLIAHGLTSVDLDLLIDHATKKDNAKKITSDYTYIQSDSPILASQDENDWDSIFFGLQLDSSADIQLALERFSEGEPPYYREFFFQEAFKRIPVGKEANFIHVVAEPHVLDLFGLQAFVKQIPARWKLQLSVQSALKSTTKQVIKNEGIEANRYVYPLICELVGISEQEIAQVLLAGACESSDNFNTSELFSMLRLLVFQLDESESLSTLSFALNLFDNLLEENDGDGPWSTHLLPPQDINKAMAGYVWAALGAPESGVRWEMAHVIRAACHLQQTTFLNDVVCFAKGTSDIAFRDCQLYFYRYNALQWLLLAMARTAKDNPSPIVPHVEFLFSIVFNSEPHVLNREFAAKTLLALSEQNHLILTDDNKQALVNINKSSATTPIVSRGYRNRRKRDFDKQRFHFGIDIGPYWFSRLGDCFNLDASQIEEEAEKIILEDWHFDGQKDMRQKRGIYEYADTAHSHGSSPTTDNLHFYLSYHAMMIVAGKLLSSLPMGIDSDDEDSEGFKEWLSDRSLTREDGFWLADRRDAIPFDWPEWKNKKQDSTLWAWTVSKDDFRRCLETSNSRLNVWGRWSTTFEQFTEKVSISSALVSRTNSEALLRALQTALDSHDFRIPDANDDLQINHREFILKGWMVSNSAEIKLDGYDPWAGSITYPPLAPAKFVIESMNLKSDSEQRKWFNEANCKNPAFSSQLWSQFQDDYEKERGRRIQVSFDFAVEFINKMNMDLIFEVQITREYVRHVYDRYPDYDFDYTPPNTKLFLMRQDGIIYEL